MFFLDSDAWLQSTDALARFLEFLKKNSVYTGVGGKIWSDKGHEKPPFMIGGYLTGMLHADLPRWQRESENPHFISSCCSLWRAEAIRSSGGFDPFYGHGIEDVDLFLRLIGKGARINVLTEVDVVHEMSDTGRHRPWREFQPVFLYLEWTRPYLRLKMEGWFGALKFFFREMFMHGELQVDYGMRVGLWNRIRALYIYPLVHLVRWPFVLRQAFRNHLEDAKEIRDGLISIKGRMPDQ